MNQLEDAVLEALKEKPLSGGKIIERLMAQGDTRVRGRAVLVYGALSNLEREGLVEEKGEGPGERVFGLPHAPAGPPSPQGHPPSFSLTAAELGLVERRVSEITKGLPPHYFEELRRVVVADADRRVFHGEKLPRAAASALDEIGPPAAARAMLRRVHKGKRVALRLRRVPRVRWLTVPLAIVALGILARIFVVGVYTLPPESISMAPTLVPAAEGGDRLVLADLLAYRRGKPLRGDIVTFRLAEGRDLFVKRVMGLPLETVSFRRGDLCINGKILVKDRALLDRVKVPFLSIDDFRRTDTGWEPSRELTEGFRLPGGQADGPATPARDAVVVARLLAHASPASISFVFDDGSDKHTVMLETGIDAGVFVSGVGVPDVSKEALRLPLGVERELWITNADGVFRVEVDRREVMPAVPLSKPGKLARVSVVVAGQIELRTLDIAHDLAHDSDVTRTLKADEYFVLGDNATHSLDSRVLGPVPLDAIFGRVFAIAWPWDRIRLLR